MRPRHTDELAERASSDSCHSGCWQLVSESNTSSTARPIGAQEPGQESRNTRSQRIAAIAQVLLRASGRSRSNDPRTGLGVRGQAFCGYSICAWLQCPRGEPGRGHRGAPRQTELAHTRDQAEKTDRKPRCMNSSATAADWPTARCFGLNAGGRPQAVNAPRSNRSPARIRGRPIQNGGSDCHYRTGGAGVASGVKATPDG